MTIIDYIEDILGTAPSTEIECLYYIFALILLFYVLKVVYALFFKGIFNFRH